MFAFDVGGLGFEPCVLIGWRHVFQSEWPFISIDLLSLIYSLYISMFFRSEWNFIIIISISMMMITMAFFCEDEEHVVFFKMAVWHHVW